MHTGLESNQLGEVLEACPIPYLSRMCVRCDGVEPPRLGLYRPGQHRANIPEEVQRQ